MLKACAVICLPHCAHHPAPPQYRTRHAYSFCAHPSALHIHNHKLAHCVAMHCYNAMPCQSHRARITNMTCAFYLLPYADLLHTVDCVRKLSICKQIKVICACATLYAGAQIRNKSKVMGVVAGGRPVHHPPGRVRASAVGERRPGLWPRWIVCSLVRLGCWCWELPTGPMPWTLPCARALPRCVLLLFEYHMLALHGKSSRL